jgi:hypothetical protein
VGVIVADIEKTAHVTRQSLNSSSLKENKNKEKVQFSFTLSLFLIVKEYLKSRNANTMSPVSAMDILIANLNSSVEHSLEIWMRGYLQDSHFFSIVNSKG